MGCSAFGFGIGNPRARWQGESVTRQPPNDPMNQPLEQTLEGQSIGCADAMKPRSAPAC